MSLGAFACGVGGAKKVFGTFGGLDGWQTAALNANKKRLIGGAKKVFGGFGGFDGWQTEALNANKKRLLYGPWRLCLRGWGCQKGVWRAWRV